jgi:hypothetical protein
MRMTKDEAARLAGVEAELAAHRERIQALSTRLDRLEKRLEPKLAAAGDGVTKCARCKSTIAPELLARDPAFFGISVTPAGEHLCSPTCRTAHEGSST